MARKIKKRSKFTNRRNALLLALALLLVGGGALALKNHQENPATTPVSGSSSSSSSGINYDPPTSQDKTDVQAHKDDLSQNSQSSSSGSTSNGKKVVTPFITGSDQNSVTAYVPGIFEDNGSCIATYSHGSTTLTKTVEAFANANYTSCAQINTTSSFFSSTGQWSVTVAYKSATSEGTSSQATFEVR